MLYKYILEFFLMLGLRLFKNNFEIKIYILIFVLLILEKICVAFDRLGYDIRF